MEEGSQLRRTVGVSAVIFAVLLCVLFVILSIFASQAVSVAGTADLPNGTVARIKGPFSCSAGTNTTEIEAGGHVFSFTPTTILVDNTPVGPLDSTVTDVQITASYWSASLAINGREISTQ